MEVLSYPKMTTLHTISAHTAGCYCIAFDPTGKHFALGSADTLVSIWDAEESCCVRTCTRLEHPVRTLSFSHDGTYLAAGSEEKYIDIADVATGSCAHRVRQPTHLNLT